MPNNDIKKLFRDLQRDINREAKRPITGEEQGGRLSSHGSSSHTTINNGPIFNASVQGSQLSWTTGGDVYQVVSADLAVEQLIKIVGDVLNALPDLDMASADRTVAQEAADEVLLEVSKPEDERELQHHPSLPRPDEGRSGTGSHRNCKWHIRCDRAGVDQQPERALVGQTSGRGLQVVSSSTWSSTDDD